MNRPRTASPHGPWRLSCPRRRGLAALGAALLAAGPAFGQGAKPAKSEAKAPPAPLTLADEAVVIEAVGLRARVPRGALVNSTTIDAATSVQVTDAGGAWSLTIAAPRTGRLDSTVAEAAEKALKDMLFTDVVKDARSGEVVGSRGLILDRVKDLRVPGSTTAGERFYVSLPMNDGKRIVRGIAFFKPLPERFVKFEMACEEKDLPAARQAFEVCIASVTFADPQSVLSGRQSAIKAGAAWLAGLTSADYRAAVALDGQGSVSTSTPGINAGEDTGTWYRFFKPASTGAPGDAEERGFRSLRFLSGTRAMIDPKITADQPGPGNPPGYLADVRARLLNRGEGGRLETIDVEARYFMSEDRNEEAWSVKTAVWDAQRAKPAIFTETGTRSGKTLTVLVNLPGQPSKTIRPALPPEGYMTQVETFLLPRLLVGSGVETELGLYAYQSASEAVSLRRDRLVRGVAGTPRAWALTTQPRESDAVQKYDLDDRARVTRGEVSEGVVIEATTLKELVDRWESKGLPLGSMAPDAPRPGRKAPRPLDTGTPPVKGGR